jgi:signal recognition particle receptor subunit beta
MAIIYPKSRILECKIVYYGPGRSGKTTNLRQIFRGAKKYTTGDMVDVYTDGDRTLFFDFLAVGLGKIKGYDIKVQLYTVPGQVRYHSTRKVVLKDVDGVVFVADSLELQREKNRLSLKDLQQNLAEQKKSIFKFPLVIQYNKRDLADEGVPIMPIKTMDQDLNNQLKVPYYPASALRGVNVGATLKECLKRTLMHLNKEFQWADKSKK